MNPRSKRPLIGHVLHRLDYAGAEILAAQLTRKLSVPGTGSYRFIFFCLDGVGQLGETLRADGYKIVDLHRRPGIDLGLAVRLRNAMHEAGVDLLHAHQYTPFFYSAAARGGSVMPPILFTEHGRHYPDVRSTKRVWANRLLLRKFDHITAVGEFIGQALIKNEGLPSDRISVIHNGIDATRFENARTRGHSRPKHCLLREQLKLAADTPIVLQVARFAEVKDHVTAVKAFAEVAQRNSTAVLLFAGDGPTRTRIEHLVCEHHLEDRVRFLGVRTDIPDLMAAADVFMLSSLSEGVSVTLLEAMSSGLAIATTDVGGNSEVVIDGKTGLLSPRRDATGLAMSLRQLLDDQILRQQLGAAGRQRVIEHFSQSQMHHAYADCYAALLRHEPAQLQQPLRMAG